VDTLHASNISATILRTVQAYILIVYQQNALNNSIKVHSISRADSEPETGARGCRVRSSYVGSSSRSPHSPKDDHFETNSQGSLEEEKEDPSQSRMRFRERQKETAFTIL